MVFPLLSVAARDVDHGCGVYSGACHRTRTNANGRASDGFRNARVAADGRTGACILPCACCRFGVERRDLWHAGQSTAGENGNGGVDDPHQLLDGHVVVIIELRRRCANVQLQLIHQTQWDVSLGQGGDKAQFRGSVVWLESIHHDTRFIDPEPMGDALRQVCEDLAGGLWPTHHERIVESEFEADLDESEVRSRVWAAARRLY